MNHPELLIKEKDLELLWYRIYYCVSTQRLKKLCRRESEVLLLKSLSSVVNLFPMGLAGVGLSSSDGEVDVEVLELLDNSEDIEESTHQITKYITHAYFVLNTDVEKALSKGGVMEEIINSDLNIEDKKELMSYILNEEYDAVKPKLAEVRKTGTSLPEARRPESTIAEVITVRNSM